LISSSQPKTPSYGGAFASYSATGDLPSTIGPLVTSRLSAWSTLLR
jgi:hypothetical protein